LVEEERDNNLLPFRGDELLVFQWILRGEPGGVRVLCMALDEAHKRPQGSTSGLVGLLLLERVKEKMRRLDNRASLRAYRAQWMLTVMEAEKLVRNDDPRVKLEALRLKQKALKELQRLDEI